MHRLATWIVSLVLAACLYAHAAPAPAPTASAPAPAASGAADKPAPSGAPASASPATTAASGAPGGATPKAASKSPAADPLATPDGPPPYRHGEDIDWVKQIVTTVLWLGLMCAVIWFILRGMYGRMGSFALGGGTRRNIHLIDRLMLGPQKAVLLIEVPGKVLLLGMTEQRITTLAELLPEDVETLNARPVARAPFGGARPAEKSPNFEASDNLVDLAGLFGRRTSQSKGEDQE